MEEIERMLAQKMVQAEARGGSMPGEFRPPSLTQRLRAQRDTLKAELARVEDALAALERHPDVSEALDSISKIIGRF